MAKKSRRASYAEPAVVTVPLPVRAMNPHFIPLSILALAVLLFYWTPLTSSETTIHWDAVDYHYSTLKYFADSIFAGHLPAWTPYLYSGFPFLSDPQTGVWYPLNWPLFLNGVTPGAIEASLAAHSLIAAFGTYFLAMRFLPSHYAAVLAAMFYAFSGFFAGHSSHFGSFQTAALFPWVIYALLRAFDTGRSVWIAGSGAVIGSMILAGHFQTALYGCSAAILFSVVSATLDRRPMRRIALCLLVAFGIGAMLSAIQVIPGFELVRHSIRATKNFSKVTDTPLVPAAFKTLVYANALGAVSGPYQGPADITQHYFYAGVLLLPLAVVGLLNSPGRWPTLILLVASVWYAFGPAGGLYRLIGALPGFAKVRAPVDIWFVAALSLALLAGAGLAILSQKFPNKYAMSAVLVFCFLDLFCWNSYFNPLTYERQSFEERYGRGVDYFRNHIAPNLPALTRLHLPAPVPSLGPLNDPLDARTETTYGYNPLELAVYSEYIGMAAANPRLLDTLNVSFKSASGTGALQANPSVLPRANFPQHLTVVSNPVEAKQRLASLDPTHDAIVAGISLPSQDSTGVASVTEYSENTFHVQYRAKAPSLLRVGLPSFPGWRASVDGTSYDVVAVDYALTAVVVPAGEHVVSFEFHTPGLLLGTLVSGLGMLTLFGVAAWDRQRKKYFVA